MSAVGTYREVGASRWSAWLVNGGLVALAVVALAPLAWMLSVSFMPTGEASGFPPPLLPSALTFDNYQQLFARAGMGRYFANSLMISAAITFGALLVHTMAGYAFAKLQFKAA